MARVVWSPEARRRLIDISTYMLLAAPEPADAVIEQIGQAAERLADFPRMGRPLTIRDVPEARELIVVPYHLVYATDGDIVEISTVLHSSMDIATRLSELLGDG